MTAPNWTLTIPGDLPTTMTDLLNALKGTNVDVDGVTYEVKQAVEVGETGDDGWGYVNLLAHPWDQELGDANREVTSIIPITTDTELEVC